MNIHIDEDLVTRSLAQLASDPAVDQETPGTDQFALALRRLKTDSDEAARIAEITRDAVQDDDATSGFATTGGHHGIVGDRVYSGVQAGEACSIFVGEGGHLVLHQFGAGPRTAEPSDSSAVAASPSVDRRGDRTSTRHWSFTGRVEMFASVAVLAICATLMNLFGVATHMTTIASTAMAVSAAIPVLVHSWTIFSSARVLSREGGSVVVLREMNGDPSEARRMIERQ